MAIIEYRIVYGYGGEWEQAIDMLMIEVNRCLGEGWELHGPLIPVLFGPFAGYPMAPSSAANCVAREMVRAI